MAGARGGELTLPAELFFARFPDVQVLHLPVAST